MPRGAASPSAARVSVQRCPNQLSARPWALLDVGVGLDPVERVWPDLLWGRCFQHSRRRPAALGEGGGVVAHVRHRAEAQLPLGAESTLLPLVPKASQDDCLVCGGWLQGELLGARHGKPPGCRRGALDCLGSA